MNYIGDYDYYLEKKEELTAKYAPLTTQEEEAVQVSDNKLSWQQQKEQQAKERKRENELKKPKKSENWKPVSEEEIDETMILPEVCTNVAECTRLSKEKAAITARLRGIIRKVGGAGLMADSSLVMMISFLSEKLFQILTDGKDKFFAVQYCWILQGSDQSQVLCHLSAFDS